jgi:hypothetical protein
LNTDEDSQQWAFPSVFHPSLKISSMHLHVAGAAAFAVVVEMHVRVVFLRWLIFSEQWSVLTKWWETSEVRLEPVL